MVTLIRWFNAEVQRWRTGAATAWSIILTVPLSVLFMSLVTFSVFDPYASFYMCLLRTWTRLFWQIQTILWCCVLLKATINSLFYRVHCEVPRTRLCSLLNYLKPRKLLLMCGHLATSLTVTVCFMKLAGPQLGSFRLPCNDNTDHHCLNERYIFIALSGCFFACTRTASLLQLGYFQLSFPPVMQRRLFEVKTRLSSLVMASCHHCLTFIKYYYLLYYLLIGGFVKSFISYNLLLAVDSETVQIDTLRGLLDISLIVHLALTAICVDVLLALPHLLSTVYHTQPFSFPVTTTCEELKDKCLHHAINCDAHPLLQLLGCVELCRMSKYSRSKRQQVFCLTTLGAQPVNWFNLHNVCLAQITRFVDSLNSYRGLTAANGSGGMPTANGSRGFPTASSSGGRSTAIGSHTDTGSSLHHRPITRTYDTVCPTTTAGTPLSPVLQYHPPAHLYAGPTPSAGSHTPVNSSTQPVSCIPRFRVPLLTILASRLAEKVGRLSWVQYFTAETTETVSRQFFTDSQKLIFIIDGLSHLVCASYTEDSYGVVQSALPGIITALLDALETLERHVRLCPVMIRHARTFTSQPTATSRHHDILLRSALKSSLKSAIYCIVNTFYQHLSIELSVDHRRRLQLFEDHRE